MKTINKKQLIELSKHKVTYYECELDSYGQRSGLVLEFECSQLDFDIMKMAGKFIYSDYLEAQRIALS